MPITLTAHPITSAFTDRKTLDTAIVAATLTSGSKFRGIQVEVPFGKKGATKLRTDCKRNGARWDGTTWMVPSTVYLLEPSKLEWFRSLGLLKAIVVSQYTDWKWDGNHQTDLIIDVPFDDRGLVKGRAVWAPVDRTWYVPALRITKTLVDFLNSHQFIVGYRGSSPVPAVVPTTPSNAVPARIDQVESIIASKGLIVIEHFHQWIASLTMKGHEASGLQCFHMNIHSSSDDSSVECTPLNSQGDGATILFFLHSGADRAYTFVFNVGLVTNQTVIQFINQMLGMNSCYSLPNGVPIIRSIKQHDVANARAVFEILAAANSGKESHAYSYRDLSTEFQSAFFSMRTP